MFSLFTPRAIASARKPSQIVVTASARRKAVGLDKPRRPIAQAVLAIIAVGGRRVLQRARTS